MSSFLLQGFYCANKDAAPVKCAEGTYTNRTGQEVCQACDPGFACREGSTSPRPNSDKCPKGYYCPDGNTQTACPAGEEILFNYHYYTV